jgi:hypothetical protein
MFTDWFLVGSQSMEQCFLTTEGNGLHIQARCISSMISFFLKKEHTHSMHGWLTDTTEICEERAKLESSCSYVPGPAGSLTHGHKEIPCHCQSTNRICVAPNFKTGFVLCGAIACIRSSRATQTLFVSLKEEIGEGAIIRAAFMSQVRLTFGAPQISPQTDSYW